MNISDLWDAQVLVYVAITATVTVLMLVLLAVLSRRLRVISSELESVRHDLRLLDEGVRTVSESLQSRRSPRPRDQEIQVRSESGDEPSLPAPGPSQPDKPEKPA